MLVVLSKFSIRKCPDTWTWSIQELLLLGGGDGWARWRCWRCPQSIHKPWQENIGWSSRHPHTGKMFYHVFTSSKWHQKFDDVSKLYIMKLANLINSLLIWLHHNWMRFWWDIRKSHQNLINALKTSSWDRKNVGFYLIIILWDFDEIPIKAFSGWWGFEIVGFIPEKFFMSSGCIDHLQVPFFDASDMSRIWASCPSLRTGWSLKTRESSIYSET